MEQAQIESFSDEAINKKLAVALGLAKNGKVLSFYQKPAFDFCASWDLLMPYVINHGIDFSQTTALGFRTGNMYASDCLGGIKVMKCEDPQRALAECLLLVLNK